MGWREFITQTVGPGGLCGLPLGDWLRLVADNRCAIDPPYWLRAGTITLGAMQNTVFRWWERARHERAIGATQPLPPLFVLGIWRSGTTHLHNLLARDERFAFPNQYQVLYPHTFLTTESWNAPFLARVIPQKRPQDNVTLGVAEPQEDEFAINGITQESFVLSWTFPRRVAHYERFLTFRDCTPGEVARFQAALKWLVQKLTYKYHRPLVLKSPAHTARIKLLLEIFPDSKFVHIHRHPYDVFVSTCHTMRKVTPWWTLQRPELSNMEERMLALYEQAFGAFFEERALIPAGRLVDIGYDALVTDPIGTLRGVYQGLDLPDFAVAEPAMRRYLATIRDYERNQFRQLDPVWKEAVARRLRRCFDEWGYAT
jgi:hypothetical protein